MRQASVSQLKTSLSEFLLGVKSGEEVLITERGRLIARLVPAIGAETGGNRKKRLIRAGILRAGSGRLPPDLLKPPRPCRIPKERRCEVSSRGAGAEVEVLGQLGGDTGRPRIS
jgi:prevent-host-death family protein